ncbi:hypothetical protein WJ972_05950 [Achromobacter insuavis]
MKVGSQQARLFAQLARQQRQGQQIGRVGLVLHHHAGALGHRRLQLGTSATMPFTAASTRWPEMSARRGDQRVGVVAGLDQRVADALDVGEFPRAVRIERGAVQRQQVGDAGIAALARRPQLIQQRFGDRVVGAQGGIHGAALGGHRFHGRDGGADDGEGAQRVAGGEIGGAALEQQDPRQHRHRQQHARRQYQEIAFQ